jgi:L1 cell adhesion molecule like protein
MVNDAEKFAEEDKRQFERVEARNGYEAYLYGLKNTLREEKTKAKLGEQVCDDTCSELDTLLSWVDSNKEESKEAQGKRHRPACP